ncbi:MAG: hypothetical protein BWK80_13495 [Desulfobacteraceae bacterium IS3]|nr:MAG: hypothetical protein BWK80_13495 [Desulfobacteraceae bacterium IS3]
MSNSDLTQLEADNLIKMPKYYKDKQRRYIYPNIGEIMIRLLSIDEKEEFLLDRGSSRSHAPRGNGY